MPRLGVSYDLTGNGKTVLKANYGLYRFNPGVGVAANANPNQATKSITYSWTDTTVRRPASRVTSEWRAGCD